jgi:hypothetical protein
MSRCLRLRLHRHRRQRLHPRSRPWLPPSVRYPFAWPVRRHLSRLLEPHHNELPRPRPWAHQLLLAAHPQPGVRRPPPTHLNRLRVELQGHDDKPLCLSTINLLPPATQLLSPRVPLGNARDHPPPRHGGGNRPREGLRMGRLRRRLCACRRRLPAHHFRVRSFLRSAMRLWI